MPPLSLVPALARALDALVWTALPPGKRQQTDDGTRYTTHAGVLHLPGLGDVPCFQLNTGERVFDAETIERLLGLDAPQGEA